MSATRSRVRKSAVPVTGRSRKQTIRPHFLPILATVSDSIAIRPMAKASKEPAFQVPSPVLPHPPMPAKPAARIVAAGEHRDGPRGIFDLGEVEDPLVGAPKEVRDDLDALALRLQKQPQDNASFVRIQAYMHRYLLQLVFRKYSFIRGYDESDVYEEALIAIFKKAIPNFKPDRGMSFLNFAKMCVNRHLITLLHASKHRRKDLPINTAISLDHSPLDQEDDGSCVLSNVISDDKPGGAPYCDLVENESFQRTLEAIKSKLSQFEIVVLEQYLNDASYKEAARNVSRSTGVRYNEKSIDNALLRIRKKAQELLREDGKETLPLIFQE